MREFLRKSFVEPPHGKIADSNLWKYGFLAFIAVLLVNSIHLLINLSPSSPDLRYVNLIVVLMLLANHLAFWFKWPKRTTVVLRVIASLWVLFGFLYILSVILFPKA